MSHRAWYNELNLILDGYNVLFQTPLMLAKSGKADLEISRNRLAYFMALGMSSNQLEKSAIVYDAKQQATTEPKIAKLDSGLKIVFAANVDEADRLIEEIIASHASPKQLTVVTSDRKIQRTAKSHGSRFIDATEWFDHIEQNLSEEEKQWIASGQSPSANSLPSILHAAKRQQKPGSKKMPDDPRTRKNAGRMLNDQDLSFDDFEVGP